MKYKYTDEEIVAVVADSVSMAAVLRHFGKSDCLCICKSMARLDGS